jgi:hypothetical protein
MDDFLFLTQFCKQINMNGIPTMQDMQSLWQHAQRKRGWIYAAENACNPGLIKLGYTQKNPFERAKSLKTAGVVGSFTVINAYQMVDCLTAEIKVHGLLNEKREDGEFFRVAHGTAAKILQEVWRSEREMLSLFQIDWLLHDADSKRFLQDGFRTHAWAEKRRALENDDGDL